MKEFRIDEEYTIKKQGENLPWDTYQYGKLLSHTPEKLFKFYSLNMNSLDCLLRNYFYLTNPGDFNDPFDCNVNLVEDANINLESTVQRNNFKNIGITSFSETLDNHLMWAHYTNNYLGWALEFYPGNLDVVPFENDLNKMSITRVIYPSVPTRIKQDYPFAMHYLLTTKFKHWSYEKEWRLLAELNGNNRELLYTTDSVKAIYIGHKVFDKYLNLYNMILEIHELRFPKIPIYVVHPHSTDLKLEFARVYN